MRRLTAMALALGALLAAPARADVADVDAFIGQPLASVRVESGGRVLEEPAILALVETRVGQPLSLVHVRSTLAHLYSLQRFERIEADATAAARGVDLVYRAVPRHFIDDIAFQGALPISARGLRTTLGDRFGRRPRASRADDMAAAVADALRAAGYLAPSVSARVDADPAQEGATAVFAVDAGPRARVGQVTLRGTAPGGEAALRQKLQASTGTPWNPPAFTTRIDAQVERWREQGYYGAAIHWEAHPDADHRVVDLDVEVVAGPKVTLRVDGDALPHDKRDELVPIRREGSVDEDLLEDSKRRIEDYLHQQGYWRAGVEYVRREQDGRLEIVFTIRKGRLFVVDHVELDGVRSLPREEVQALVRFRTGEPFVEDRLRADAEAVARHYLDRGYTAVKVDRTVAASGVAAADPTAARVVPRLAVTEGPVTRVGRVTVSGNASVDEGEIRRAISLAPGAPYRAATVIGDRNAVYLLYLNRGYREATVESSVSPSADHATADVTYAVTEGAQALIDHVIIVGNRRTSSATIAGELQLGPGDPAGLAAVAESQRRLSALGLFRRVRVDDVPQVASASRDLIVTVEEAPATSLGYGAGLQVGRRLVREGGPDSPGVERIEFAPRGFVEVGRRNLWGKNRSVNLFARGSLGRRRDAEGVDVGGYTVTEYRLLGTYREPRPFEWNAVAQLSGVVEQVIRTSYSYRRQGVTADLSRSFWHHYTVTGRYSFGNTNIFQSQLSPEDVPLIDRLFPQVRLGGVSGALTRDTRDDPLDPARGSLATIDGQLAARPLGGEVGFVKGLGQLFAFRLVPGTRRVVLAGGLRLGIATGFAREVVVTDANGNPVIGPDGQPETDVVKDLPASERFYAGGDTTVRGFTLDRLGDVGTIGSDDFPTGGNALIILNGEVRFPLWRALGGVAFVDAGNVFLRASDFDLGRIRGTGGFGLRYKSPVGPIRLDVGFKFDRQVLPSGAIERPYVVHISLGQAF